MGITWMHKPRTVHGADVGVVPRLAERDVVVVGCANGAHVVSQGGGSA